MLRSTSAEISEPKEKHFLILDPNSSFSVGGGLQIALTRLESRKEGQEGLYTRDWEKLNDEPKLANVLYTIHHQEIEKHYNVQTAQQPPIFFSWYCHGHLDFHTSGCHENKSKNHKVGCIFVAVVVSFVVSFVDFVCN